MTSRPGELARARDDIFAGLVASVITIAYGLSFAALIFAPPLNTWLAYGIAATFITSAVTAAIVAARSSLPFAIAGPDPTTVAVTATLVSALMARLADQGLPDDLLAPVAIIMALSAALTGVLLFGLGLARAGGAIRFIPYPVIGGFLGASGCLMVSGAVRVITGHGIGITNLDTLLEASVLAKLLPAIAIAVAIYLGLRRRGDSPYILPAVLLVGIALAHVVLAITGTSMATAEENGWLFKAPAAVGLTPTWDLSDVRMFPWHVLPALSGDLFAVMFVTAISTLLNTTGLEFLTKREADLQRELKTVGVANVIAGALGGYVSTIALNRTTLNYVAGARGRLSGLTVAAVSALMLIADPGFLAYVPKFVLGGLLLYLGANLVYEWLINSARRISLLEYASLLAIAVLILQIGFIAGVFIGVVIGCTTFAVSASRVNAIKFSFDGSEYRSTLDRGPEELAILAANGHEIQGMSLQSYIFFGSANRLYEQVKSSLRQEPRDPLPAVRLPPGHRHRFLGDAQLYPDQASRRRARRPARAGQSLARDQRRLPQSQIHRRRRDPRRRSRPGARGLRERSDRGASGRRRHGQDLARLARPGARQRRLCRAVGGALREARSRQGCRSSPRKASPPARCISSSKAASASSSKWMTGA